MLPRWGCRKAPGRPSSVVGNHRGTAESTTRGRIDRPEEDRRAESPAEFEPSPGSGMGVRVVVDVVAVASAAAAASPPP